mgnify:CR=1 FL=1
MQQLLLTSTLLLAIAACGPNDPPTRRYHTRGQVTELLGSGAELTVTIHHERIEGFEDRDGKRSAMPSMVMAFGPAPDVARDLWSQGAKVGFDFEVRWSKQPTLYIVKAEALPPDTALDLSQH